MSAIMRILMSILIIGTSLQYLHAEGAETESPSTAPTFLQFSFGPEKVLFINDLSQSLTISENCKKKKSNRLDCDAYHALSHASVQQIAEQLHGGMNPGSPICRLLGGEVEIGLDPKGNDNAFCQFPDGSRVDCGTLAHYAAENDRKQR